MTASKMNPIPVRLDEAEGKALDQLITETGLSKSDILRRACRFALPKFLSGEVDIARVSPTVVDEEKEVEE